MNENKGFSKVRIVYTSSQSHTSINIALYIDDVLVLDKVETYNWLNVDETFYKLPSLYILISVL